MYTAIDGRPIEIEPSISSGRWFVRIGAARTQDREYLLTDGSVSNRIIGCDNYLFNSPDEAEEAILAYIGQPYDPKVWRSVPLF